MLKLLKVIKHPSHLVLLVPQELAAVDWVGTWKSCINIYNMNNKKIWGFYCLPDHILSTTIFYEVWLGSHLLWTYFSLQSESKSFANGTNTLLQWRVEKGLTEHNTEVWVSGDYYGRPHAVSLFLQNTEQTNRNTKTKSKDFVTLEVKMLYLLQ